MKNNHRTLISRAIISFFGMMVMLSASAADRADTGMVNPVSPKRINIIVSSKNNKLDPAPMSFHLQSHWQQLFHKKQLHFMIVGSVAEMSERVVKLMEKEHAMIGSLWIDSHGHMGRRISLFEMGKDEVNYASIQEPYIQQALASVARYCDTGTQIGIGSCYSAANFTLPAVDKFPEQRMNGDSLMIHMSEIMNSATVYGTEGWVMTRPGIYNSSYALAGKPGKKKFKDPLFLPVWKNLGEWKAYSATTGQFTRVQTLGLDKTGTIKPNYMSYLAIEKNHNKQMKIIGKLKEGNFSHKWFYKFQYPPNYNPQGVAQRQGS